MPFSHYFGELSEANPQQDASENNYTCALSCFSIGASFCQSPEFFMRYNNARCGQSKSDPRLTSAGERNEEK